MNKKFFVLLCLILFVCSVSYASASDDFNQSISEDIQSDGTFSELQENINNANESTVNLDKDYVYDGEFGGEGILIDKAVTINGNGYTINGNHASRLFFIDEGNVVLKNISFINGQTDFDGVVYAESENIEILDCSFMNNVGGALHIFNSNGLINNSLFLNNSGLGSAIYFDYTFEHDFIISNSIFDDNVANPYLDISQEHNSNMYSVYVKSSNNLADHQIAFYVDQDSHLPYYNFSNLTFVNVSYNEFKNQSYKVKLEDFNPYLANETVRFEVFKDNELLINSTAITDDVKATIDLGNLSNGEYILNAYYQNLTDSIEIYILKEVNFTMSVDDIVVGDDLIVDFNISSDIEQRDEYYGYAAGDITILRYDDESDDYVWAFDDYFYFKNNNITVPALPSGSYVACLHFSGDKYYFPKEINQTFNIYPADYNMGGNKTVLNVVFEKTSDENSRLCINLTDIDDNPLNAKEVFIKINGVTYKRTTDDKGFASIAVNLGMEGDFSAIVSFKGDDVYLPSTEIASISIPFTIYCDIFMSKYCGEPQPFVASFLDYGGDYLSEGKATFNINGVFYTRNIDWNGQAKLNINLHPGNYTITATNPLTGAMRSCWIEILPTITDNHDLVKYYRNDSQYIVKLQGENIAGQKVTFNINGVFYERYSNDEGFVKLNINLPPNDYIITAEFNGCRVSNNISVLPVLEAKNLKMSYKDGSRFNATLVDGQGNPYAGQSVTFNINGVFYQRTTDENGVARLNINLMAGEYIITSSYNGCNIANKITIV